MHTSIDGVRGLVCLELMFRGNGKLILYQDMLKLPPCNSWITPEATMAEVLQHPWNIHQESCREASRTQE